MDWYVVRIDRHAKNVVVIVVVVYWAFLCGRVYLTLLAPGRPVLVSSMTKKSKASGGGFSASC